MACQATLQPCPRHSLTWELRRQEEHTWPGQAGAPGFSPTTLPSSHMLWANAYVSRHHWEQADITHPQAPPATYKRTLCIRVTIIMSKKQLHMGISTTTQRNNPITGDVCRKTTEFSPPQAHQEGTLWELKFCDRFSILSPSSVPPFEVDSQVSTSTLPFVLVQGCLLGSCTER